MSDCPKHAPQPCSCWSGVDFPAEAIEHVVGEMVDCDEYDVRLAILELAKSSGLTPHQANVCAQHAIVLHRRNQWYDSVGHTISN